MLKKERFGGTCTEEAFWKKKDGKEGMIFQVEDCRLCKEHCPDPNNGVIEWKLLEYPGRDAACVGYCSGWRVQKYRII